MTRISPQVVVFIYLCLMSVLVNAAELEPFVDQPLEEAVEYPDWFSLSFLDLREDLREATEAGKKGMIVYFGRDDCPYCKVHLEKNWGNKEIVAFTREYFHVIAIDAKGGRSVTDMDGKVYNEKAYSILNRTNFTPSFIFYDLKGKQALKINGYHPPYKFRAALEFVAGGHYKTSRFRDYLARAEMADSYGEDRLNSHTAFMSPPYLLDRSHFSASVPLAVFFEQKSCHACDLLHAYPLRDESISNALRAIDTVQLDVDSDQAVLAPDGRKTKAKDWADKLGLYYYPTIIFFDEKGKEIIRIDSVVWQYRLKGVISYVMSGAYKEYDTYQQWRERRQD